MQEPANEDAKSWLDAWLAEDYSWGGLVRKDSWRSGASNLQEFLRGPERARRTDSQLSSDGHLVDCGEHGLFHILFVPPEWAGDLGCAGLSEEELRAHQTKIWAALRSSDFRESFVGKIAGVHLPDGEAQALVGGTRASFEWTSFHAKLNGIPKRNDRKFESCSFEQTVVFNETLNESVKPKVSFENSEFLANVVVNGLGGVRELSFESSTIHGRFIFEGECSATIRVHGCVLSTFDSLGCNFERDIDLFEARIAKRFSLTQCTFEKTFSIVATELHSIELLDCDFKSRVTFADVEWPPFGRFVASAEGSKFLATASFVGSQPPPVQFFQNAEFASSVAFSGIADKTLRRSFYTELSVPDRAEDPVGAMSMHALAVENGARTLRKLAEQRGDVHQEHLWHRSEIIARRQRGEASRAERFFSFLYGGFADYGLSISRPLLVLFGATIVFAIVYAWLGGPHLFGSGVDWKSIEEGTGFSLNRTIPIGAFADEGNVWRKNLLGSGGDLKHILIRIIATSQSILSAVLAYLVVMAVRRKFRIS